ncbi:MAG: sodium ion-translocating decarboxylase subunit beta [Vicinamibacterales bacterium]|jgi:oxaloacetate decarboxylase beta subunit|nr:sodium ion-translocating decarboxylase subunit beta [Vicinamibacterales bacterium]HIN10164.1 sodium ion-translocating decarboxylase subunit beta [Acidobacteriota bacterium]
MIPSIGPETLLMFAVGGVLLYLAIAKQYEPMLLLPIGFGVLLGNLPNSPLNHPGGMLYLMNEFGIQTELLPLFIFIGIGAMMDFRPLLSQPIFAVLGAAGQLGIFATLILATLVGFPLNEAASIAVIGAIDGPTSIYVSSLLAPRLLPAIAVTAYSYMSLVPIIQPPLMRLFTTRAERRIRMEYAPRPVPRAAVIAFPIIVTIAVGVLVPASAPLVATLMFGNLLKESGVVPQLANAASSELANISTLFLGLTIGSLMQAATFLQTQTLFILLLGLIAFVLDTVAGLLFGKGLAVVTRGKINPLVGAAGISAFPMSGRLVQKVAQEEDFTNHVLMHAMGANTAGQLGSVIAGGVLLTLVELLGGG